MQSQNDNLTIDMTYQTVIEEFSRAVSSGLQTRNILTLFEEGPSSTEIEKDDHLKLILQQMNRIVKLHDKAIK